MSEKKPTATITISLGDANNNGIADLSTSLTIGDKVLGPVVVDVPHAPALSLLTSIFDGGTRGLAGIAAGAAGAVLPRIFGETPSWMQALISSVSGAGDRA